ncbi:MAG: Flp pilus assembly protein CpaB [Clostridia bacterium]|nr:Flp pilus assembly protein CpaB [Clostridia bacterium]
MKKLKLVALFAALILGLATYQFLKEISKPVEIPRTKVIVAATDIKENTVIDSSMLAYKEIATESLLPGFIQDPSTAYGKVMQSDIYAGEMITQQRLIALGENSNKTLEYIIEPGMRAFTISAPASLSNNNMIKPGNHVDLILSYPKEKQNPKTGEIEEIQESTIDMQNLKIIAVDKVFERDGLDSYNTFTLQVTPEDAVRLNLIEANIAYRFILRSALDEEIIADVTMNIDDIIDRY